MSNEVSVPSAGIEYSFVDSWESWDMMDVADLYFYDVKLKEEVFGAEFIESLQDKVVDLFLSLSNSTITVSTYTRGASLESDDYVVVLTKEVKLVFAK